MTPSCPECGVALTEPAPVGCDACDPGRMPFYTRGEPVSNVITQVEWDAIKDAIAKLQEEVARFRAFLRGEKKPRAPLRTIRCVVYTREGQFHVYVVPHGEDIVNADQVRRLQARFSEDAWKVVVLPPDSQGGLTRQDPRRGESAGVLSG